MQIIDLIQGSPEWLAYRATALNASEAPIMLGLSPYERRDEFLARRYSGVGREPTSMQQKIFEEGHRIEDLARTLAEKVIGDDLYPVVGASDKLSASFDGLTLDQSIAFEHKTLNDTLRSIMFDGCTGADLPAHYRAQMQQQMMVSGCEKVLFVASKWDGDTLVEERHCWYLNDPALAQQITDGWEQFERDLADYRPPVHTATTFAEAIESLPAIYVQLEGRVLSSNLPYFVEAAKGFIETISTDLQTDQDFANAKSMIKFCSESEKRLATVKEQALGQTQSIDELFRTINDISAMLRGKRLQLDKLVSTRELEIKRDIVARAMSSLANHITELESQGSKGWLSCPPASVIEVAMKGKRTIESLEGAANSAAANLKVELTAKFKRMQINHEMLLKDKNWSSLFPDFSMVGDKSAEDFSILLQQRIQKLANDVKAQTSIEKTSTEPPPQQTKAIAPAQPTTEFTDIEMWVIKTIDEFLHAKIWNNQSDAIAARALLIEFERYKNDHPPF